MERDELSSWLRLQLTSGVGNTTARQLLSAFGLPEQLFTQSASVLGQVVSARQTAALLQEPPELQPLLERTWQWLQAEPEQHRVLTLGDPQYPSALLHMADPPLLLYGMGTPKAWQDGALSSVASQGVAVVGSRNPTPQGLANARLFSESLAQAGCTIVSGLALGVDGAAHEGALQGAGANPLATVAVVGTGLDRVYPRQHLDLAHRISRQGVLLSEYPLGTAPLANHFPQRNRIIAGLTRATLVVEAALQSGSLITARLATEQGKDVFAIPGSIHSTQARGCHALIKQGAKLVECAQDILEEFQWSATAALAQTPFSVDPVFADNHGGCGSHAELLEALGFDPLRLDALQARTGLDTATLQAQLMELELQGRVARLPGGLFQRIARC